MITRRLSNDYLPDIPAPHAPDFSHATSRAPVLCVPAAHAARDFAGQLVGRVAGLAIYTGAYSIAKRMLPLSICVGAVGAISGATLGHMLSSQQIGTHTPARCLGSVACTLGGAMAGGAIAAAGSTQPVMTLAVGCTLTAAMSIMKLWSRNAEDDDCVDDLKGIAAFMGTAATLTAACVTDHDWHTSNDIAARNLGVLGESMTVEFFKSTLERCGSSIDRQALNFNGKVLSSLAGTLPYVAATVFINGVIAGLFQPGSTDDSHLFGDLLLPTMIGALANAARGFANASATECLYEWNIGTARPQRDLVRPHTGVKKPEGDRILTKTAIRFFISSCRNAVYTKLRSKGLTPIQAGIIAQSIYGFFAQNRDLIFDLMQGEGWVAAADTQY